MTSNQYLILWILICILICFYECYKVHRDNKEYLRGYKDGINYLGEFERRTSSDDLKRFLMLEKLTSEQVEELQKIYRDEVNK